MRIELEVNGERHVVEADPAHPLLNVLREELSLTGTKYGCGEGQCGACTVLLDGREVRSCRTRTGDAAGHAITTIEGLARDDALHPVQQAFLDEGAFQCAYCTPGMILGAVAFLRENPDPSASDIARGMRGHVCRCGTYPRISAAIARAAKAMASGDAPHTVPTSGTSRAPQGTP